MPRAKRWWHDNINLIVAQSLIQASRDFFRRHVALAPLAPLPKPTKLRRLYAQVEERLHEQKVAADFKPYFQLTQKHKNERAEEQRRTMKKYGLPEDISPAEFVEYLIDQQRERANRMAVQDAETALLKQMRDGTEGDTEKEITLLRRYFAEHPESEMGANFLVGALSKARRFYEAIRVARNRIEVAEREVTLSPGATETTTRQNRFHILILKQSIASMLLEQGEIEEGIEQLERTIAEEDREGEDVLRDLLLSCVYLRLGDAYREKGTSTEARTAWKIALHLRQKEDAVSVMSSSYLVVHPGDHNSTSEILKRLQETADV